MTTIDATKLIARNLSGVCVGDTLIVKNGAVFQNNKKVSTDLTRRVAPDGQYVVQKKSGAAPGDVGYYGFYII